MLVDFLTCAINCPKIWKGIKVLNLVYILSCLAHDRIYSNGLVSVLNLVEIEHEISMSADESKLDAVKFAAGGTTTT